MAKKRSSRKTSTSRNKSSPWPADQVERRPLTDLIPYAQNARMHSPEQVKQIVASIQEWGWTNPVLIDENGQIIAGHGRVLAAQKLKIADVPVMVARGWTETQKRAYVLADNQLALNGSWDEAILRLELDDLKVAGADLDLIGFSEKDMLRLLGDGTKDADTTPQMNGLEFRVVLDCEGEDHQKELLQRFEQEGLKCRALIS